MPEKSTGKKNGAGTTLDLMGDEEAAKPKPARKPAAQAQAAEAAPSETNTGDGGGALFGGDEVDLDARHPADVPALGYPAPSQIAQVSGAADPFADDGGGEEDPFEDTVMARMLADEPAPLLSPLRAARENMNEAVSAPAGPDLDAFADPVAVPEVEQVVDFEEPALREEMETPMPAAIAEAPAVQPEAKAVPAQNAAPGLTFTRRYTKPGQNVWDTTEWELRNAAITGSDGTVVFEQNGVEIPKSWSQLATNVVVSKYFRGQIGTLEREYSVKQLIGRVADKILEWGQRGAYFATDGDAEVFHDELRYILLHQFAAFNSPVWFNLGWAGRRQAVSACYITEVDDSMESILDLYKTEGMLFKDGSGSGHNLSPLRSSKEPLSAGGRSSGPIAFMKGLDASAGSIKSGGSTRRAAKMVILNADHPDIQEFIDCKKDAELKAHALIDAGYSGAFNVHGGAYDTVPFQNANHSVRVTDAFMQAVETDGPWETKFRTDGKTAETLRAKDLLHSIAEGTWVCLPPGELILTEKGERPIETIQVGDRVWTHKGRLARVDHPMARHFAGDLIEISVNGYHRMLVTDNHPVLVSGYKSKAEFRSAEKVSAGDYLMVPNFRPGDGRKGVRESQATAFLRLLGYYLAEGSVEDDNGTPSTVRFTFHINEADYTDDVLALIKQAFDKTASVRVREDHNVREVVVCSREIAATFMRLCGRGASGKRLNEDLFTAYDSASLLELVDTWLRGDGHDRMLNATHRQLTGRTVSEALARDIFRILVMNRLKPTMRRETPEGKKPVYSVSLFGRCAARFYNRVPRGRGYLRYKVQSVRRIPYEGQVYNLNLDRDSTFLTNFFVVHNCGDPGMQYDTTANDWHTCANTDRIHASNPCVTGDTLVATADGWQRIDSLVGQSARIIGADGLPHFVSQIFPTGHKPVFKLRTRAGFEVTITGNHQVLTTERGDVAVDDLRLGDHLHLEGAGFGRRALSETLALAIGVAVGDGCLSRQTLPTREQEYVILTMAAEEAPILDKIAAELNHQKAILRAAGIAGHPGAAAVVPQSVSGTSRLSVGSACVVDLFKEFAVLSEGSSRKSFTPVVYDLDKPALAAVLRGLFTADGTVANYGDKSQYVAFDSTSQKLLQQVQVLLLSFGIKAKLYTERRGGATEAMLPDTNRELKSYAVQETHSLRISKASRVIFEREIGFDPASAKAARLRDMNLAFTTYKDTLTDEVVSITAAGTADVYDLTEAVTSHFVANGLVVHNCSEFFFLNSTACNLSSLNLMKFRDARSGAFDTESFEHAVKVMITAQEIVVGFAHYPTEKIEERSHRFRPLGLGYANLGALLMADGLPYDSDAGRAYAGAVTALMTGRAYHQSAVVARDCGGAFEGFAENREPMLRVMGKHRAAVDDIAGALIPKSLLDAARTAWDDALDEGQVSGYRNAQATVLAPTGCLVAGSLVITNKGVVRLGRLGDVNGAQWQDVTFDVLTDTGRQSATKFYVNGLDQTRRIETHCGYAIQGTPKHRIKVVNAQTGQWDWKRFGEIVAGDVVALSLGQRLGDPQTVTLPPLGEEYWTGDYTTRVPKTMTPELAEIVGYFMGDGSLHAKGPRFCVANTELDVAGRVQALVKSLFNLDAHLTPQQGYCEVGVHSVPLALWWDTCGFSKLSPGVGHAGKGYLPRIPDAVLATNDPAVYGAFLRGLYEADGTVTGGVPCWSTVHRPFSEEVKTLLLALGIPTSTKQDTTGWSQSPLWVLRLRNTSYASKFTEAVGFMSARKASLVSRSDGEQAARHDCIYLAPEVLAALVPKNSPLFNAVTLSQKRHNGATTRRAAESLYAATRDERVAHALRFFYDVVTANDDGGEQLTYDLSVPVNVTYIAQGFVSHNTIGFLMDCDTTGIEPDIAIVKYKSLVGGGMMKIVNQTVPEALQRLGYDEAAAAGIIRFIDEHDTIEGAPGLQPEHLAIFDCAFRPMNGTRSIHYRGHLKMMAAAQPFISGAISKTCNMPNDATPDEIAQTYLEAWKLGIKAVAIYRDGSKRTQPLNMQSEKAAAKAAAAEAVAPEAAPANALPTNALAVPKAVRRRLPDEREGVTHKFSIGGHEGYLTVGLYPDTRQPGEIFIRMSKEGSSISGLMDSFATAISLALQYGVPLSTLVDKFIHSRFEPSGFTGNKEIPMAKSVMDYIFRYLALRFLQKEDRHNVGLLADQPAEGDAYSAPPKPSAPAHDSKSGTLSNGIAKNGNGNGHTSSNAHLAETNTATLADHEHEIYRAQSDAPPCPECGAITIRNGACYRCISCGTSLGCS